MCETYYGFPPAQRPAYLLELITKAREGNGVIRRILTNRVLLQPRNRSQKVIHWRGSRNYPTIAQEAHAFCKWYFDAGIAYVIDHPEHKPVSDTKRRAEDRALREFENRLKAIQKRVLPGLEERPHHTLEAVVCAMVFTRGPRRSAEYQAT